MTSILYFFFFWLWTFHEDMTLAKYSLMKDVNEGEGVHMNRDV